MTKWFPSLIALVNLIAPVVSPAVAGFWAHHAAAAVIAGSLGTIIAHFLPSPFASAKP